MNTSYCGLVFERYSRFEGLKVETILNYYNAYWLKAVSYLRL